MDATFGRLGRSLARLMVLALVTVAVFLSTIPVFGQTNKAYDFVSEYVRQLGAMEDIRKTATKEESEASDAMDKMRACIANSERFRLELGYQLRAIQDYAFDPPIGSIGRSIAAFYDQKMQIWQMIGEGCSAFIGEPKQGTDYGAIAARMPKLRVQLEAIDKSLFETVTPVVFMTLIDMRPDSKNHVGHLTITTAQRDELVKKLQSRFGAKLLEKDNQNYEVASASVLKAYLTEKGFKCADEPWE